MIVNELYKEKEKMYNLRQFLTDIVLWVVLLSRDWIVCCSHSEIDGLDTSE